MTVEPTALQAITLVKNAIHNPSDPRHFMRVTPAGSTKTATRGTTQIARSDHAVVVKEVGRDIYDPIVYFDRAGVDMALLARTDKSTHCPLKGDTEYFDLVIDSEHFADAAWSYVEMILGDELKDLIAFNSAIIDVT